MIIIIILIIIIIRLGRQLEHTSGDISTWDSIPFFQVLFLELLTSHFSFQLTLQVILHNCIILDGLESSGISFRFTREA